MMNQDFFDDLTRAMNALAPRRQVFQLLTATTTAGIAAWFGRGALAPQTAQAVGAACQAVDENGSCPPNTDKRPKPGNTPTTNGCGPEGGSIKIPQGFGKADYTSSCNSHDVCYEDCAKSKAACDDVFLTDMQQSCAEAYPGFLNTLHRTGCYERAYIYYQAVSQFGDDAWKAAQQKACECCGQSLYCQCNNTCYDDVSVCLSECKVSLGCFTGICGPAEPGQCPGV